MNDWKIIWNSFCDEVTVSVRKNNLEKVFEEDIAREFFRALDWYRLNKGLMEQYPVKFATVTHRADFALFVAGKESPEIIVELKRPKKKKEDKDAKQLIDYMKQKSCSYGILLLGDKLEIYYINYNKPQHEASLVESIKYQHDNDAARQFMEVLFRNDYTSEKMHEYCLKRVKINKSIEYWCSFDGKAEILNMIIERSQLPEHLQETLRSTLLVDVKRKDGLTTSPLSPITHPVGKPVTTKEDKKSGTREPKVWMISANPKFFDHKSCFDKLGVIYWKQYNNLQAGDTGYIYYSKPYQRITMKYEVLACDLPFSEEMTPQKAFYKKEKDFIDSKQHNRLYKIRLIEESPKGISLADMLQHGLKQAPLGALNLSDKSFDELRTYIEENF